MSGYISDIFSNVLNFLSMVRLSDIIDVIIIAFLVYQCASFVRETRANLLIKGVILLLILLQLSRWFHLNTLQYILQNIVQLGFFALLIVFQPELRRGLEKLGRSYAGKFFSFGEEEDVLSNTIDTVCSAIGAMAKTKTGSLICIQRSTKLGDIIHTGTPINAEITYELLVNIFVPNTPLHDGAVIIADNKITAAACFLPLTSNNDLSKELGTRHRAAIGLSENSDAVVIVVSEETGKISIALDGDLTRNLTVDTLKLALKKVLTTENENNGKIIKLNIFKKEASE